MFINFFIYFIIIFIFFFGYVLYYKIKLSVIFRGGYAYSMGYIYSFCQMFHGLHLFKGVHLFQSLEYEGSLQLFEEHFTKKNTLQKLYINWNLKGLCRWNAPMKL